MKYLGILRISPALMSIPFATMALADTNKLSINGDTVVYDTNLAKAEDDQEINCVVQTKRCANMLDFERVEKIAHNQSCSNDYIT